MVGYLGGLISGINICVFGFGATGSGKTYTIEGEENESGLVGHFTHELFVAMEDRKKEMNAGRATSLGQSDKLNFSVRIRYLEMVDEEVTDLLLHT